MMCRSTLLISFWGYALETVAYILNLVPTKKVSKTPFEMWKGKRPSLGYIKIWGYEVFVRREAQDKLNARSEKYLFVGYPKESFGYLFYKPKDNVVFVARRGVFLERDIISKEDSGSKIDLEEIKESVNEEPIVNTDSQQEVVTPVEPNDGFHIEEDKISDSTLSELDKPTNYKEAMASPEAAKWKEAMKSKIQSMYDNQVWNLVDATTGLKTIGCKWIFKKKTDMDGKVHTYKARLVAKGYTQTHEIDYEETFSSVAKINVDVGWCDKWILRSSHWYTAGTSAVAESKEYFATPHKCCIARLVCIVEQVELLEAHVEPCGILYDDMK
ncbi:retrotransposon protein, putative, ty1-copia subclass [Tanacetum coccineum]